MTPRRAISWIVASLYFGVVVFVAFAHTLNPYGDVSGVPAVILSLPWSIALFVQPLPSFLLTLAMVFGGAINAAAFYWFIVAPVARFEWLVKPSILGLIFSFLATTTWFLNTAEVANLIRVARGRSGIYMATDQPGLRALSETIRMRADISKLQTISGIVFIAKGTRARYRGRKFLLKTGRIADPYPADPLDMMHDGTIVVERIRITEGPNKGIEGWVPIADLQRGGGLAAL